MTTHTSSQVKIGHLAVFLATSGHSGVDRVMKNLLPAMARLGVKVDLLHVNNHGPHIEPENNLRVIELGTAHTYSSLPPLIRYLRREKPDVLFSDKDRVNRVAILAQRFAGTATRVVVRTGTTVSLDLKSRRPFDRFLTRMSMTYLYRWADRILLPSQAAVQDFQAVTGFPPGHVQAVPSPVATPDLYSKASIRNDNKWLSSEKTPLIVGIGELSGRKDFSTLIRAFAVVRSDRPARLIIFGEGKQRAALESLIEELGLLGDIDLPGFEPALYPVLASADLYVHSSRQEGAPVALMEAVALGVPCVSTDCPSGPAEILQNGKYGSLVEIGDFDGMAHAMLKLLDAPPERDYIRRAAQPFTLTASVTAYLDALGITSER